MMIFDKSLSLTYAVRYERVISVIGDLPVIYALYELDIDDNRKYAVVLSDGEDVVYRLINSQKAAKELFETVLSGGVDTSSFSGVADDLIYNNIL